jgi:transposase
MLEGVRKRTKPRTVDLHEVFNAVLSLLESGCQWRMLPDGFAKWRTVHSYFAKWSEPGQDGISVLERALKKSVGAARTKQGRNAMTSFLIVDAQSVKNTDSAELKAYDAGRRCLASSAMNCTLLSSCPNAGSSNAPSYGWKSAADYGKTANENSIPACSSFPSPSSPYCSADREQALSGGTS